jgi:hypothetical protein
MWTRRRAHRFGDGIKETERINERGSDPLVAPSVTRAAIGHPSWLDLALKLGLRTRTGMPVVCRHALSVFSKS